MTTPRATTGVILLAMGGPETIADIPEYLFNIFSDRNIIRLPGGPLLQKPFARMISKRRSEKVKQHYNLIGGGSPLRKWTETQRDHLAGLLSTDDAPVRCYVAMRYIHPMVDSVIGEAYAEGCRTLYFLPMYPQYCRATTGSSFAEACKALKRFPDIQAEFIDDFHENADYLSLLREYIATNIRPDETLLFSAHSIPQSFVDDGDPYVDQVKTTAALAASGREYYLSFQSRTGPVKWVGPDTVVETRRLLELGRRLFVVPISFVCDHIETLYEIDIELRELTGAGDRLRRMPMFNEDPRFAQALTGLINARRHE